MNKIRTYNKVALAVILRKGGEVKSTLFYDVFSVLQLVYSKESLVFITRKETFF